MEISLTERIILTGSILAIVLALATCAMPVHAQVEEEMPILQMEYFLPYVAH